MAKIYIRFELIGSGNLDYRNIVSARLVKDRYTPYSELRASVVLNNSINLNNIRRVALYIDSRRMHYGPADYIRTRVRGGKTVLELISRGITLMLGQNEPEPGVWSKVSLTDIMKSYSPSSEITYESGTDTVNYVNIKEKSTLWEAIGVYAVKAYGRRAYIRGDRQVNVSLSILSVNIGTQRIIEYGKQLHVVNLGRIAGTLFMLMAVRKYRNIGGAVVGALTTCGVLLCTPSLARNTLLLATSGLICGAFLQFGSLVIVLVFLAVSLVSLVAMGVNGDTFSMFADLLIGSVLFIALPVPVIKRVAKKVVGVKNSVDLVGQTTSSKLSMASRTLGGIRGQLTMVTAAIDKRSKEATLSKRVRSVVCTDCDMYSVCSKRCVQLDDSFSKLESIVCTYNNLSLDDVEKHLGGCVRKSLLCKSFNELYTDFVTERADSMRVREMREFLSEQLSSMEDILSDLSFRAGQVRSVDPQLSARVREHFSNLGYPNVKACVYIDENLCQRVDVFITAQFRGDLVRLTATLSEMIDYDLDMPVIVKVDNITRMSFAEIPKFTVDIKSFSASSSGEYSGDSFEVFDSSVNEKYIVLSDGMGTGKRARLDSLFSVSLVTRLIRSGMSMQTAHRLINSMLRVKGWEESFATLDIMRLELNGGTVQFLKSGAAQSFLFRDGGLKAIGGQAFPAGILAECTPDVSELKLFDGDVLLMTSDGVEDATAREILRCNGMNAQEIVTALGAKALAQRTGGRRDDITIIAAKIFLRDENEK